MLQTLTQSLHYIVLALSIYTLCLGIRVYLHHSVDLSRVMNKFLLYANLTSFLILSTDIYRLLLDRPYMASFYVSYVYLTQFCMLLLALNIIKTARELAQGWYD